MIPCCSVFVSSVLLSHFPTCNYFSVTYGFLSHHLLAKELLAWFITFLICLLASLRVVTFFPYDITGSVWYIGVSVPDRCSSRFVFYKTKTLKHWILVTGHLEKPLLDVFIQGHWNPLCYKDRINAMNASEDPGSNYYASSELVNKFTNAYIICAGFKHFDMDNPDSAPKTNTYGVIGDENEMKECLLKRAKQVVQLFVKDTWSIA